MQLILLLFNFIKYILVRQGTGFQLLGADAHVLKLDLKYSSRRQRPFAQSGPKWGVMLPFLTQKHFCSRINVWKKTIIGLWSVHFYFLQTNISSQSARTHPWQVMPSRACMAELSEALPTGVIRQSAAKGEDTQGQAFLCASALQLLSMAGWSHNIMKEGSKITAEKRVFALEWQMWHWREWDRSIYSLLLTLL